MSWTDARVDRLKALWEAGNSCSEIANDLGDTTRNAVIGKARRLNLPMRNVRHSQSPKPNRRPRVRSAARIQYINGLKGSPKPPAIIQLQEETSKNPVTLMGLNSGNCHWPISPENAPIMFCGDEALPGYPYCWHHHRMAHVPTRNLSQETREMLRQRTLRNMKPVLEPHVPPPAPEEYAVPPLAPEELVA